jgi:hypothetical protein
VKQAIPKTYKRISDGKITKCIPIFLKVAFGVSEFIKYVYYIPGEPANIEQKEVDDKKKFKVVKAEYGKRNSKMCIRA